MVSHFDLVPVFHLVGIFVHVYPIELRGPGADGRDEAFALPAPVVLGVRQVVACEGVAGGFFEFQIVFDGDVEVMGYLDIELKSECECLMIHLFFRGAVDAHLVIFQHHHAAIDLRALRRVLHARCDEIRLLSAMLLFRVLILA